MNLPNRRGDNIGQMQLVAAKIAGLMVSGTHERYLNGS
jgi:hypothetical protein